MTTPDTNLDKIRALTNAIRDRQHDIVALAQERRGVILDLRGARVTYRQIAEAMGTTEQNVYKILRQSRDEATP